MKHPLLPVFLILSLAGVFAWRETRYGILVPAELALEKWAATAAGAPAFREFIPTVVLQGGIDGGQLSAIDIGLFARASLKLGARVAAVAAYEFPPSQISLNFSERASRESIQTRFVAGSLLLPNSSREGLAPLSLAVVPKSVQRVEMFRGAYSSFTSGAGWSGGFVNLPTGANFGAEALAVAMLGEVPVASFSLATVLGALGLEGKDLQIAGDSLALGGRILPLSQDGSVPLLPDAIRQLRRLDMDDLLLESERQEQGNPPNPEVMTMVRDQILLLGTLGAEQDAELRLGSGRRLSLVEYQGVSIASFFSALRPLLSPWWVDFLTLLLFVGFGMWIWKFALLDSMILGIAVGAAWLLFALTVPLQGGFFVPILAPIILIFLGGILRILLKPTHKNAMKKTSPATVRG